MKTKQQQAPTAPITDPRTESVIIVTLCSYLIITIAAVCLGFPYAVAATGDTRPNFNFGAAGDWNTKASANETANNMKNHGVELAIGLGDYAYSTGSSAVNNWWNNYMKPLHGKFQGALGNHDTSDSYIYLENFDQSSWVFSFNYQNVHFLSLDTEKTYAQGSSQYKIINDDLAKASDDPNVKWIIVFFHRPMYTSPTRHAALTELADTYHPLFDKYEVDLVLQGHNHNYQRSYPIRYNTDNSISPIRTSNLTTDYTSPKGQIYLVVGTGGTSTHSFSGQSAYIVTQYTKTHGFLNVDVLNDGMTLRGSFFSNEGTMKDQFSITKP